MYNQLLKCAETYSFPKKEDERLIDLSLNEVCYGHPKAVLDLLHNVRLEDITSYYKNTSSHDNFINILLKYINQNLEEKNILTYNNVLINAGSDVVIEQIFKTFLNTNDHAQIFKPSYPLAELKLEISCNKIHVPLDDKHSVCIDEHAKLIYYVNPNNPLGYDFNKEILDAIIKFPNKIFIVDEAYIELSDNQSFIPYINQYPNVIVVRTLSKGFGLPGIRIGYCVFNQEHWENMNKTYSIRNLSPLSVRIATAALENVDFYGANWKLVKQEYKKIKNKLSKAPLLNYSIGSAPFYLIMVRNVKKTIEHFKLHNILVRDKSSEIPNSIRITVSTPEINNQVLQLITDLEEF